MMNKVNCMVEKWWIERANHRRAMWCCAALIVRAKIWNFTPILAVRNAPSCRPIHRLNYCFGIRIALSNCGFTPASRSAKMPIAMRNGKTYPDPVKLLMAKPRAPALRSVTPLPMRSLRRNRSLWFAVVRFKSLRFFRSKSNISGRCFKLTTAGPEHGFRPNVMG